MLELNMEDGGAFEGERQRLDMSSWPLGRVCDHLVQSFASQTVF